jgi:hypothetical protein
LRQRVRSARRSARGSNLRSTSRITWTKPASCSRSARPSPPARFSTISAHLKIEPALLPGDPDMLLDRDIQPLIRSR